MQARFDFNFQANSWTDIIAPERAQLSKLSQEFGIPKRILENCLAPEHLPSFEIGHDYVTMFLRVIDPTKKHKGDSVQDLTTKIAFFITDKKLITIHRLDPEFVQVLRSESEASKIQDHLEITKRLLISSLDTFGSALDELEVKMDEFEEKIFSAKKNKNLIKEGFLLKRRVSAYKKVLKFSQDILKNITTKFPDFNNDLISSKEILERNYFYADELLENISGLLNLYISISSQKTNEASYKTNEVMRILTVFSLFFLPLNFIVGLYGMNFVHMPELQWHYGYPLILGLMICVSIIIFWWVNSKGWLTPPEDN